MSLYKWVSDYLVLINGYCPHFLIFLYLEPTSTSITFVYRHLIMRFYESDIIATAFWTRNRRPPIRHMLFLLLGMAPSFKMESENVPDILQFPLAAPPVIKLLRLRHDELRLDI